MKIHKNQKGFLVRCRHSAYVVSVFLLFLSYFGCADGDATDCLKRGTGICRPNNHDDFLIGKSEIESLPGQWPPSYCWITNVYFNSAERVFFVGSDDPSVLDACYGVNDIWDLRLKRTNSAIQKEPQNDVTNASYTEAEQQQGSLRFECDQIFEEGHAFTIYYYHGSNYFHLHTDTFFPLYSAVHYKKKTSRRMPKDVALMPTVELRRGKGTAWATDAFMNESSYWMEMLRVFAEPFILLPLDGRLTAMQKTMCFKTLYFGAPKVNTADKEFLKSFVSHVKSYIGIENQYSEPYKPVVGIIHRSERRKVLNEEHLMLALKETVDVDLIEFSGKSFREQVSLVQKYAVLSGMNGAGLMNAIYLPPTGVAIQMVPYKAQLNYVEFRTLLQTRGLYLEWHNKHKELSKEKDGDLFNNTVDTVVEISEFLKVIHEALSMSAMSFSNDSYF